MDEFIINLDKYQNISKSGKIFNTVLGAVLILLSVSGIFKRITAGQIFWDYFIFILIFIFGVNMILYTYGFFFHISRRYVVVNNKGVEYKLSYFYPSRTIRWNDIVKVEIKTLRIHFHAAKGIVARMKLGEIFYSDIKRLKQNISELCADRGIEWSDTTVESELARNIS